MAAKKERKEIICVVEKAPEKTWSLLLSKDDAFAVTLPEVGAIRYWSKMNHHSFQYIGSAVTRLTIE